MPYGSGLSGQLGYAAESVWGTPVTVTKFQEFLTESLNWEPTWLDSAGLKAGQAYKRVSRVVQSRKSVSGGVEMEAPDKGLGLLLKHAMGSAITVPTVIGATTAYKQIHTPGTKVGMGLTIQVGRPQTNGTVQAFCVDEQTEILTQRGWISHHSLDTDDIVLSFDPTTRQVVWEPVISVHRFDWDGPLTRWETTRLDALTTPNHRWLVETGRRAVPGDRTVFNGAPTFRTTEELAGRHDYLITGGGMPACFAPAPVYTDEFVELIGWVVTEGYYQTGSQGVIVAQNVEVNPAHSTRLRALAEHYRDQGATASEYLYDNSKAHWYFGKGIGNAVRQAAPDRQLTPTFLAALTIHQAQLLYNTLLNGDGSRRQREGANHGRGIRRDGIHGTEWFSQKDSGRIDGFQMLAAMLGRRTHSRTPAGYGGSQIAVYRDDHTTAVSLNKGSRQEDYVGVVWCPRTRTGTWMARRAGCTYWTGNTYEGCKIGGWEFSVSDGEISKFSFDVDGQDLSTATALAAASYTAGTGVFSFSDASLFKLGGTAATASGETTITGGVSVVTIVRGFTLRSETGMANERFGLGNAGLKNEQIENAIPTITGSLEGEFTDRTEIYDVMKSNTTKALQLDLTHGDAGGGNAFLFSVIMPAVKFKTANVNVGGPDVLGQSVDFEAYDDGTNPVLQIKLVSTDSTLT